MSTEPQVPVTKTTETTVSARPTRPDNWRTVVFVGALITVGLMWGAWMLFSLQWAAFCLLIALFEAWTLVNRYHEDTISEAVWFFAKRPLVPLLFGLLTGIAMASGYMGEPLVAMRGCAIGLLLGHFFFSRHDDEPVTTKTTETTA